MTLDSRRDSLRAILLGKTILVVEDDPELAPRLLRLFQRRGSMEPVVRGCMTGADAGGLECLLDADPEFDLAVVDIMLPRDQDKLAENDRLHAEYMVIQKSLMEMPGSGEETESNEVQDKRLQSEILTRQIRGNISPNAGIDMMALWGEQMRERHGTDWRSATAILFLTAREDEDAALKKEALEVASRFLRYYDFLAKPVRARDILETAARLLEHK